MLRNDQKEFDIASGGNRHLRLAISSFCFFGLLALGACTKAPESSSSSSKNESSLLENEQDLSKITPSTNVVDSAVDASDPDDSIFPLSFLMNDATDYSGCNPDVDGETACF